MENKRLFHQIIIPALLISACGAYTSVDVAADAETNFNRSYSFAWLPDSNGSNAQPYNNEVVRNNIRNYFSKSFALRGYRLELDTPDLLMNVTIINIRKVGEFTYVRHPMSYYYGPYYFGSIYYHPYHFDCYYRHRFVYIFQPPPVYIRESVDYVESTITLNIINRKSQKTIWTATAKGDIYDPDYFKKDIHPAVEAIMKKFPVPPIDSRNYKDDI